MIPMPATSRGRRRVKSPARLARPAEPKQNLQYTRGNGDQTRYCPAELGYEISDHNGQPSGGAADLQR
ncbi:hypothetical protein I552_6859 [Mycobacterium xenopi 3993]|nr:hypothetical protein I552_6859 [Mycobacterium xenopi 3993]